MFYGKQALRNALRPEIPIGTKILHQKTGGEYTIIGYAFDTRHDDLVALYRPKGDNTITFSQPYRQLIYGRYIIMARNSHTFSKLMKNLTKSKQP